MSLKRATQRVLILLGLAAALAAGGRNAAATVPGTIAFQGYLTDPAGVPLNGSVNLEFALYGVASGGTALWTEAQSSVVVSQGVFAVALGSVTPFPDGLFDVAPRHLGIRVNGETEMPRTELRSTPFALRSRDADSVTVAIALRQNGSLALESEMRPNGPMLSWRGPGIPSAALEAGCGRPGSGQIVFWNADGDGGFDISLIGQSVVTGDPVFGMFGEQQSATFSMGASGNSAVTLPSDAVGSFEMLDEPGVANAHNTNFTELTSTSLTSVISRTITPPATGFVLALGQGVWRINHAQGTSTSGAMGLSDDGVNLGTAQDANIILSSNAPTGSYGFSHHVNGVFSVSGGSAKTIHLLASETSGDLTLEDLSLTLVYLPTAYGTASPMAATPGSPDGEGAHSRSGGQSEAEITAERTASVQANQDRIAAELAAVQAQIDALRREFQAEVSRRP